MSYLKEKNRNGYLMTFTGVVSVLIVAFLAVNIITHKKEEEGGNLGTTVVLNSNNGASQSTANQSENLVNTPKTNDTITKVYKDGSYTNLQTYYAKGAADKVEFKIEVKDDKITNLDMVWISGNRESKNWVNSYVLSVEPEILNKDLSSVSSAFISGATYTSNAFKQALIEIKKSAFVSANVSTTQSDSTVAQDQNLSIAPSPVFVSGASTTVKNGVSAITPGNTTNLTNNSIYYEAEDDDETEDDD